MQQQSGNPAVRQGLVFGGLIALVSIIQSLTQFLVGGVDAVVGQANSQGVPGLGALAFLATLALLFLAGMFTARQNSRVGSATIAGLIAGAIGGLVSGIIVVIGLSFGSIPPTPASSGLHITRSVLILAGVFVAILFLLFYIALGAGVGAIGGLIGRTYYRSRHPAPSYQESMYQGYPQPGAYPPPGGYPYPQPGAYPPPGEYPYPPPGGYPPPPQPYPQPYPPQQPQEHLPQYPPQYPPHEQPAQYPPQQPQQQPQEHLPPYPPQQQSQEQPQEQPPQYPPQQPPQSPQQ